MHFILPNPFHEGRVQSRKKYHAHSTLRTGPTPVSVKKYNLIFLASGMILSNFGKQCIFPANKAIIS